MNLFIVKNVIGSKIVLIFFLYKFFKERYQGFKKDKLGNIEKFKFIVF